ncbi:Golgi-associated plant pathoproteinsis-related protein 1 [Oleoguttula sp. CCFEE 5521]
MAPPNAEEQEALDLHNHGLSPLPVRKLFFSADTLLARKEVGNADLLWHERMLIGAASWAKTLAERDSGMPPSEQPDGLARCGENIYCSGAGMQGNPRLLATQCWYDEKPMWHGQPVTAESKGSSEEKHYTQTIWMETTHLGIAAATAWSGSTYVVGRYWPAGNCIGMKPAEKVAPPSAPTFQGGGGMRGGDGGGGMGGGMVRPGGFGGGQMGGISGMPSMSVMTNGMCSMGGGGMGAVSGMSGMTVTTNGMGGITVMNNGMPGTIVMSNGEGGISITSSNGGGCMSSTTSATGPRGMNVNTNINGMGSTSGGMMPGMMAMGGVPFEMPPGMQRWMMGGAPPGTRGPTSAWGGPRPWSAFG